MADHTVDADEEEPPLLLDRAARATQGKRITKLLEEEIEEDEVFWNQDAFKEFDCGIHPAYSGMAALPYFDEIDPSTVDVLLVTHFHLDHAASLPYFLEKTTFKGRVFMTHATKAIYGLMLSDYVKVSKVSVEDMLYDEQDILCSMDKTEVIDFHQTLEVNGIRFWCYTAGHVLGAAMFMVDIAGVRILYTGDYSREEDRHLRAAELPQFSPDICIIESTYRATCELLKLDSTSPFSYHHIAHSCLPPISNASDFNDLSVDGTTFNDFFCRIMKECKENLQM